MKKQALAAAAFAAFFLLSGLYADGLVAAPSVVNPTDSIYSWLDVWASRGLIAEEPFLLRPYSPDVLLQMLSQVSQKGTERDRALADAYAAAIKKPSIRIGATANGAAVARAGSSGSGVEGGLSGGPLLTLNAELAKGLWAAGNMSVVGYWSPSNLEEPMGESASSDLVDGGGALSSSSGVKLSVQSSAFAGGASLWVQAGMGHASFGPFFSNGIVVGPQAPEMPYFDLNLRYGGWRFTQALFELQKGGSSNGVTIPSATGKHAFFHSFSYSPAAGWDLGIFEAVVSANRVDPMYLLPLADYFLLQARSGYGADGALGDNSLAGVYAKARVAQGLDAKAIVYIDDIGFGQLAKLDFDSKYIFSAQGGLSWAPEAGPFRRVEADYTAVMPYMYAHYYSITDSNKDGVAESDYQNDWTTSGENLGPALDPNSDRLEVRAFLPLQGRLELSGLARLIRHGNASDIPGLKDQSGHDGSISDNGWGTNTAGNYEPSYQPEWGQDTGTFPTWTRFLIQDTLEYSAQAGLGLRWGAPIGAADLSLSARCLFEYRVNDGLVAGVNNARVYFSLGAEILF